MNELDLAKRFSDDVDRILQDNNAKIPPVKPDREEYMEAIALARRLAAMDLSEECRMARDHCHPMLENLSRKGANRWESPETEAELDDYELDNVAGGINHPQGHLPEE